MQANRQRAFTLVELIVVVAVIAILSSLILSGVNQVRQRQIEAEARVQMQGLSLALLTYLDDYGIMGEDGGENPTDFQTQPALFLVQRPTLENKTPYIENAPDELADADGKKVGPNLAVQMINPWGRPIEVEITNAKSDPTRDFDHTFGIVIVSPRSSATKEPLRLSYTLDTDVWEWSE